MTNSTNNSTAYNINYKTVSVDTLRATVIDKIVSFLPECVEGYQIVELDGYPHEQLTSDAVYCNLLSTIFADDRKYSGNEIDRLVKFIASNVHGSVVLPILVSNKVMTKHDMGYTLSQDIKDWADRLNMELSDKTPMVNTPMRHVEPWTNELEGVHPESRMKLVSKSRGTKVSDLALQAVNKLQATQFKVSPAIVAVATEYADAVLKEQLTVHTRFKDPVEATAEYERLGDIITNAKFTMALGARNKDFSFAITMDWRGRMYYRNAFIQPQGSNFEKAALIFANSMPMSDEALEGLMVGVANELGMDKASWEARIEYMTNGAGYDIAWEVSESPTLATISKYVKRDKAFLALTGCVELVRVWRQLNDQCGSWEGIESCYVVHQDGTCNGIQHAAALLQDRTTAYAVNCTASTTAMSPQDIYNMVAKAAAGLLASYHELALLMTRDVCKVPVMVTGYGASTGTVDEAIADSIGSISTQDLKLIQTAIHAAISLHAAAVVAMTKEFDAQIKAYLAGTDIDTLTWRTPDGMIIKQKYMDSSDVVVIPSGFIFKLSKHKDSVVVDSGKMARAASPNFIHSLDAAHLRAVIRECDHELVAIHDSVGSHPATFAATARVIREEFVKVHQSDPMKTFTKWNGGIALKLTGDYDVTEVLASKYFFS